MSDLFAVRVHHLDGGVIVELDGELDVLAAPALRDALGSLAYRYDSDQVTIDCRDLAFIDMSSFGVLIGFANRLGPPGLPCLQNVPPLLGRILHHTGTAHRFMVSIDERVATSA
jgi:anti-anti-sigma factor